MRRSSTCPAADSMFRLLLSADADDEGRLLGRLCMEADVLGRRRQVAPLAPGDTGVVRDAGASDASMTYPFGRGQTASG